MENEHYQSCGLPFVKAHNECYQSCGLPFVKAHNECCQSCGLPFDEAHIEFIAKEADGSDSLYCTYCYSGGVFLNPDATVEEMVGMGVPHLARKIGEQAAREQLSEFVPTLTRWKGRHDQ